MAVWFGPNIKTLFDTDKMPQWSLDRIQCPAREVIYNPERSTVGMWVFPFNNFSVPV